MSPPDQDKRELPISLRGIEDILHVMNNILVKPSSIRQIRSEIESLGKKLSVRVCRNILLQLEKLNQVERILEGDMVTPKWALTRLGREVAKSVYVDKKKAIPDEYSPLLYNINIPKKLNAQNLQVGVVHSNIISVLNEIQFNLSKSLGICFNLEQPIYADTLGNIQKQIRLIKREIDNLRSNPLSYFKLKKSSGKKIGKQDKNEHLVTVILFANYVIFNQINQISENEIELSRCLEPNPCIRLKEILATMSDQIRVLNYLLQKRKLVENGDTLFPETLIQNIQENNPNINHLSLLLPANLSIDRVQEQLESAISQIIPELVANKQRGGPNIIPFVSFCNVLKDRYSLPKSSAETIELALINLSKDGMLAGIADIIDAEQRVYKVIMLETVDQTEDERTILTKAIKLQAFSLAEIVKGLEWSTEKTEILLQKLTKEGYLRHTDNYLHGNRWYIVS